MDYFHKTMKLSNYIITNRYTSDNVYKSWCDLFDMPIGVLEWVPSNTNNVNWYILIMDDMKRLTNWVRT